MKDNYGRKIEYLRLSLTDLCNQRCLYCMPAEGVCRKSHAEMMTEEETITAVKAAASLGITKIRLTGGEPLLKRNILSICQNINSIPGIKELCITTNGTLLTSSLASELRKAGVKRINISLDSLIAEKYVRITRIGNFQDALAGLHAAVRCFDHVKINTVLIRGFNDDEVVNFCELTRKYPVDVRFIELMPMPFTDVPFKDPYISVDHVPLFLTQAGIRFTVCKPAGNGTDAHSVAKHIRLDGARGRVGLISPVSNKFCPNCNRIRITADGKIKPCLHSREEYSFRGKTEDEIREIIKSAIDAKPEAHTGLSGGNISQSARAMNAIGG